MSETLTRNLRRWQPPNTSSTRYKVVYLHPTEYLANGYKPMTLPEALGELKKRYVQFGVDAEGVFWFDQQRMCLTPGLLASLYYYFPHTCPVAEELETHDTDESDAF